MHTHKGFETQLSHQCKLIKYVYFESNLFQLMSCWLMSLITACVFFPLQIFLFCTYRVLYILYMMSSLGGEKARGPREKALPAATHTSQPQKQIQVSNSNHLDMKNLTKAYFSKAQTF